MRQRFDVTENLEKFYKILKTKHVLRILAERDGQQNLCLPHHVASVSMPERSLKDHSHCD
jgi:hypothetical protein